MSLEIIHKSLYRPQLFLGVDRELAMYTILISIIVAAGGYNLISLITGVVFFIVTMRYLRKWSKMDPQLRDVFIRYVSYIRSNVLYQSKSSVYVKAPVFMSKNFKQGSKIK
jgi:type IV secretory pathway TrbD component